jgi:hypothetical protein
MPTLGEFIARARKYGFKKRIFTIGLVEGDTIVYLWRDADHFVELPTVSQNTRLTRVVVEMLCGQLGIPGEDFGVEI